MHNAFRALTLVGWIEWWRVGIVICLGWSANDLYMLQLMPLPPHHLLLQ